MTSIRGQRTASVIFENIIFLVEVFGDQADNDIPKIPVLEMAQCFDLARPPSHHRYPTAEEHGHYGNKHA